MFKAVAATLGVLASIATIVTFVMTVGHSSSSTPPPGPTSSAFTTLPAGSTAPANPTSPGGPVYPGGSVYTASATNIYMSHCEQTFATTSVFCQCTWNWYEANVPYPKFVQDMAVEQQFEQSQTDNPPYDEAKAVLACH